jgi:hypothetical protein
MKDLPLYPHLLGLRGIGDEAEGIKPASMRRAPGGGRTTGRSSPTWSGGAATVESVGDERKPEALDAYRQAVPAEHRAGPEMNQRWRPQEH